MTEIEQAEETLRQLKEELVDVKHKLEEAKALEKRAEQLDGGFWGRDKGGGLIGRAAEKVAELKHIAAQKLLPKVVFLKKSGWSRDDAEYVVEKVTPKRIFVQQIGCTRSQQYDRDGKEISGSGTIDMKATFE